MSGSRRNKIEWLGRGHKLSGLKKRRVFPASAKGFLVKMVIGMPSNINWQCLKPWDGSKNTAFEALCCQLAEYEPVPSGSKFYRKAPPDAGIECFWKLPNGDESGWQAKFFPPPDTNQWRQLDESVKTALEKHPRLTSYTICLPIDRQDPRLPNQKWFMDKWNEYVEKWCRWSKEKGMIVEFIYWGEHEIFERLSREEHRGRRFFWFNEESFSPQWFKSDIDVAVSNAGPRYSAELNVELPIASLFDGLGRTSEFYNQIKVLYGKIKRAHLKARLIKVEELAKDESDSLKDNINKLLLVLEDTEESEIKPIEFQSIEEFASKSMEDAWKCIQILENASSEERKKDGSLKGQQRQEREELLRERHHLYELERELRTLRDYAQSNEARISNMQALLVVGSAGTGKTHLFCDVARQRVSSCLPTVLLLGGHFKNEEPWSQIVRLLDLSCTREEFLGALEAAAKVVGARALILIDALNEGEGKTLWHKHLAGMLTTLGQYPWVAIAVSVRTSYENIVIPQGLIPDKLIREVHHGFAGYEYQATQTFFDHFGIERPSIPLLVPEFQNPLFLIIFCKGLQNRRLTKVPPGLKGITTVFEFFIESVNEKLSRPENLDFGPRSRVVQEGVEKLAEMMAEERKTWLPRAEAQAAMNGFLPRRGYENSLFRNMVSEGLIAEDRFRVGDDEWLEGIHFSYERFADHLTAKHLLDKHLNTMNPLDSFLPNQPLGSFIKDEPTCWRNRGLVEAFSIQLPERIKKELSDVAPGCSNYQPIREAFVESLIWRLPEAITGATLNYINEYIIKYDDTHDQFLNALLTIASNPDHPYNADFLHKHLMKLELAKRDAWWSIFLYYQWGEHGAVDRLVDWAWSPGNKSHIDDKSVELAGMALAWFLTTSNRFLRDRATKALLSLLTDRICILRQIIGKFLDVNDPYVLERLFAVAYGCSMRSTDNQAIGELAKDIYEWIFKNGEPPPHILLRDYARGVIELALHRGITLDIEIDKSKPPYKSKWPEEIPIEEELKQYGEWKEGMPREEWARWHLYNSVMGFSDFARYIIGTNSGTFEWSSWRINEPKKPSSKELYEDFVKRLTPKQRRAWERYIKIREMVDSKRILKILDESQELKVSYKEVAGEKLKTAMLKSEQYFHRTLGKKKLKIFEEQVIPYLKEPARYRDQHRFDLSIAQCWILKRVIDLGWTVERFGRFDNDVNSYARYGREAHKPERIGKKYQWIAYHEFLARVSDNFEFTGEPWSDRSERYEGPWQIYARDIDPSCLLTKTGYERWRTHTNTWWFPISYSSWDAEADDVAWLKNSADLPAIEELIEVKDPDDQSRWLVLEGYYTWKQPVQPEEELSETSRREISYLLNSYIVAKSDMDKLFEWAKQQHFWGRWMPESRDLFKIFLGEFFWSPAFKYHCSPFYDYSEWTRGHDNVIPKEVLVTAEKYLWESTGYDCSIDENIHIYLPVKRLAEAMQLQWNGVEGHFFDAEGNLIAFDPSVTAPGPGALLMNRNAFLRFLNDNGYDILWTVLGEKQIMSGTMVGEKWKGELQISGAFRMRAGKVEGIVNPKFVSH